MVPIKDIAKRSVLTALPRTRSADLRRVRAVLFPELHQRAPADAGQGEHDPLVITVVIRCSGEVLTDKACPRSPSGFPRARRLPQRLAQWRVLTCPI
jgi:hypothetical protein